MLCSNHHTSKRIKLNQCSPSFESINILLGECSARLDHFNMRSYLHTHWSSNSINSKPSSLHIECKCVHDSKHPGLYSQRAVPSSGFRLSNQRSPSPTAVAYHRQHWKCCLLYRLSHSFTSWHSVSLKHVYNWLTRVERHFSQFHFIDRLQHSDHICNKWWSWLRYNAN